MAVCLTAGCGNSGTSDGSYTIAVTLSGGSGKATIESPTVLTVKDGKATAKITWSSANYDYMIADGVKYTPEITDDKSVFEIPVSAFDQELKIAADTTAMSQAHEIEYTLKFDSSTLKAMPGSESGADGSSSALPGMKLVRSLDLKYADQFSIDYYDGGYALISVKDTGRYLVVPSGKKTPAGLDSDITVIQQPIDYIYLAATSAMDMFRSLDSTDQITLSGVKENDWYIDEARQAMENGKMRYAGKYSAPDYELIASQNCDLAIESTMIYHTPEVREQLENLKIPVFVEHSSYESDPDRKSVV